MRINIELKSINCLEYYCSILVLLNMSYKTLLIEEACYNYN